jgi:hypothetical protein
MRSSCRRRAKGERENVRLDGHVKASGDSGTLERLGSSVLEWAMGGEKRDVEIGANVREQGELDWIGRTFSRRYMSPGISRSASPISFLFRRTTHTITSRSTRNRRQQKKTRREKEGSAGVSSLNDRFSPSLVYASKRSGREERLTVRKRRGKRRRPCKPL